MQTIVAKIRALLTILFLAAAPAIAQQQINLATQVKGNLSVNNLGSGTAATALTFWRGDGAWASPTTAGFVTGPISATNGNVALFDGVSGTVIKDGGTLGTAAFTAAAAYLPIGGGTLTGNLLFTDFTYNIGASGANRPQDLFLARNITVGSLTSTRVPYSGAGGMLQDSPSMTFNSVSGALSATTFIGALTGTANGNLTSAANSISLGNIAQIGTNTVLGNSTSGTANVSALSVGGCSSASSALIWTTNTGFGCNTGINAATLGGATFAAPGAIGGGTPSSIVGTTGVFTGQLQQTLAGGNLFNNNAGGTAASYFNIANTSGRVVMGVESSVGGTFIAGSTAYDSFISDITGVGLVLGVGEVKVARLSSAGVVVSGTLNVSGVTADTAQVDVSLCYKTSTGVIYYGTGTLGVCLGLSSDRYKHDITPLRAGLNEILLLRPVSYYTNKEYGDPTKPLYGFITEQGGKVLPKLMGLDEQGRPNTFDYLGVVPVLVKAVQEQQAQIKRLEQRLLMLERPRALGRNALLVSTH